MGTISPEVVTGNTEKETGPPHTVLHRNIGEHSRGVGVMHIILRLQTSSTPHDIATIPPEYILKAPRS